MSITVCKFGGSSAADAGMFVRMNRIIGADTDRKYIVLSAPGKRFSGDEKITDLFYRAHDAACTGDFTILTRIYLRYASIRDALAPDFDLEAEFAELRTKLHTSRDFAASRGEYLCAKLFAAYTGIPFVDAKDLLIFDADGKLNAKASRKRVCEVLTGMKRAVIPGFYGALADGSIHTFSRGGSDVSGALICSFLNADLYENWTDVDGLFTADPQIVPCTQRNLQVSYRQMEQIARAGAQLLHPDALQCLAGSEIDTLLKNTFSPGAEGTRISDGCHQHVRCITGRRLQYMIGDPEQNGASLPLLHDLPVPGSLPVSVVNAFGMRKSALLQAEKLLNPIHIIHMQHHIQFIIPVQEYETAIRSIHALIIEDSGPV